MEPVKYTKKKLLKTEDDLHSYSDKAYELAEEAKDGIMNLNFKQKASDNGCKFCNFSEICYKKHINIYSDGDDDKEENNNEQS